MAVIPERARLVETGELVGERVACGDRTLVYKSGTILPVGACLIDTVEMLRTQFSCDIRHKRTSNCRHTTEVDFNIVPLVS